MRAAIASVVFATVFLLSQTQTSYSARTAQSGGTDNSHGQCYVPDGKGGYEIVPLLDWLPVVDGSPNLDVPDISGESHCCDRLGGEAWIDSEGNEIHC